METIEDENAGVPNAEVENERVETETPTVSAHRTTPDRIVLTEEGNSDGWIATDLTVEPRS